VDERRKGSRCHQCAARGGDRGCGFRFDLQDPGMLHDQMLDEIVCHKLNILGAPPPISRCEESGPCAGASQHTVNIAFVGK